MGVEERLQLGLRHPAEGALEIAEGDHRHFAFWGPRDLRRDGGRGPGRLVGIACGERDRDCDDKGAGARKGGPGRSGAFAGEPEPPHGDEETRDAAAVGDAAIRAQATHHELNGEERNAGERRDEGKPQLNRPGALPWQKRHDPERQEACQADRRQRHAQRRGEDRVPDGVARASLGAEHGLRACVVDEERGARGQAGQHGRERCGHEGGAESPFRAHVRRPKSYKKERRSTLPPVERSG